MKGQGSLHSTPIVLNISPGPLLKARLFFDTSFNLLLAR